MFPKRRRRLEVELLETRDVPTTTTIDPIVAPTSTTTTTTQIIDPTEAPVDPSSTAVQVTVTALGAPENGVIKSVTVTGLSANNVQLGNSLALVIGGVSYYVELASLQQDGSYRLSLMVGVPQSALAVGNTASVIVGNGGTPPTDPTLPPQP